MSTSKKSGLLKQVTLDKILTKSKPTLGDKSISKPIAPRPATPEPLTAIASTPSTPISTIVRWKPHIFLYATERNEFGLESFLDMLELF
ncbi:hypothetical protein GE09DRAFT_1219284 [Coniochaeta sp. 2T2.1]|nr:hypothetical protein GE09DRAFT_1219284 [Coniochaeta sp. 2T2.1]